MPESTPIRFAVLGAGLMGREFASATARWCHLEDMPARPVITAVGNRSDKPFPWFREHVPTCETFTHDWDEMLGRDDVDAVYMALPHHLHAEACEKILAAGKDLMAEKPLGIDGAANARIMKAIDAHPDRFVRCVSQFPFFPAVQKIGRLIEADALGRIIEVRTSFLHSSDLNPDKPANWKRIAETNGRSGALADLGVHACHVPLRAGWRPRNVSAVLSNLMPERWSSKEQTEKVDCETFDNATVLIDAEDPATGDTFPWTLRVCRIAPGERNSWELEILGTKTSVRFSSRDANTLWQMDYDGPGASQDWRAVQSGFETAYPTITGPIFEFGFPDALQQMWAAFAVEHATGEVPHPFAGCARAEEAAIAHSIFDAALASHDGGERVATDR